MKRILIVLFALVAVGFSAAQTDWVNIGDTDDSVWDIQSGSLEESRTKGGTSIVAVVGRVTTKASKQIDVRKWYVSVDDCERKMGKLVTLDIEGKYKYENEIVFGAGSIGSSVAEMICGAYKQRVDERAKKGI